MTRIDRIIRLLYHALALHVIDPDCPRCKRRWQRPETPGLHFAGPPWRAP